MVTTSQQHDIPTSGPRDRETGRGCVRCGVLDVDPAGLDVAGLKSGIGVCGRLRGTVSAVEAALIAELADREGEDEATKALQRKQRLSRRRAKRRAKTAKTTAANPDIGSALADGEISDEHADVISDSEHKHPGAALALLEPAKDQSVDYFRHTARGWEREQDGDEGESEAARQHKNRKVTTFVRPEDGMGVTIAELAPPDHEAFTATLAFWVRRLLNQERCDPDRVADTALIVRTSQQRLADALMVMAAASLDPANNAAAPPTAQLLVILGYDPLTRALQGRLGDGTVVSPETVRRLSCDAGILPAVFNSKNQPINLGTSTRNISPALRALLVARDGHCRGCGASHHFCQAHHIVHWANRGLTDLDNLVLLCNRCHHLVHEGGHHIHKQPDGSYTLTKHRNTRTSHETGRPGDRTGDRNNGNSRGSGGKNNSGGESRNRDGTAPPPGAPTPRHGRTTPKPQSTTPSTATTRRDNDRPDDTATRPRPKSPNQGPSTSNSGDNTPKSDNNTPDPDKMPRTRDRNPIASNGIAESAIAAARQAINDSPITQLDIFNYHT